MSNLTVAEGAFFDQVGAWREEFSKKFGPVPIEMHRRFKDDVDDAAGFLYAATSRYFEETDLPAPQRVAALMALILPYEYDLIEAEVKRGRAPEAFIASLGR